MNSRKSPIWLKAKSLAESEEGFVLIVGLMFLVILTLVGTTAYVMTSTDIKVGGNFKNYQKALQVAEAGAERGREKLRALNASSSNINSFDDELQAMVGSNAVLDGYSSGTDDDPLFNQNSLEGVSYIAYLTNDSADGTSNQTDGNNKVLVTSVATGPGGAFARIELEVTRVSGSGPPIQAPVYSTGDVTGNGSSMSINGNDNCGVNSSLAPIYTKDPATTTLNGTPTLDGADVDGDGTVEPDAGSLDIDIGSYVDSLKAGATVLTADVNGTDFGDANNHTTVYSDTSDPPNNQGLKMQDTTGYGMLLVDGDLTLGGNFQWNGLILVTGTLTFNGGGQGVNINGAVLANNTVDINGGITIVYDSCEITSSLPPPTMKAVSWRQVY